MAVKRQAIALFAGSEDTIVCSSEMSLMKLLLIQDCRVASSPGGEQRHNHNGIQYRSVWQG